MDGTDRKELGFVCAPRLRYCTTVAKKSDGRHDARPSRGKVEHIDFELEGPADEQTGIDTLSPDFPRNCPPRAPAIRSRRLKTAPLCNSSANAQRIMRESRTLAGLDWRMMLKDINIDTLEAAIRYGLAAQNEKGKLMK